MNIKDMEIYHVPNVLWHYRVPTYNNLAKRCKSLKVGYIEIEENFNVDTNDGWVEERVGGFQLFDWKVIFNLATIKSLFTGSDCFLLEWNLRNIFLIPVTFFAMYVLRKRVVWWGHGESKNTSLLTKLTFWAGRKIPNCVVVYMDETKGALIKRHNYLEKEVYVARNGVDTANIDKYMANIGGQRNDKEWVSLYSGRLNPGRDLDRIVRAIYELNERGISCRHVFIGDGEERENLQALAKELNVENKIQFYGAVHKIEELSKIYAQVDYVIIPGWLGLALTQSYAFGKPAIICDEKEMHNPEIRVYSDAAGWKYVYKNDSLAVTMQGVMRLGKEGVRRMGEVGHSIIAQGYSTEIMVDGLQSAIEGL